VPPVAPASRLSTAELPGHTYLDDLLHAVLVQVVVDALLFPLQAVLRLQPQQGNHTRQVNYNVANRCNLSKAPFPEFCRKEVDAGLTKGARGALLSAPITSKGKEFAGLVFTLRM